MVVIRQGQVLAKVNWYLGQSSSVAEEMQAWEWELDYCWMENISCMGQKNHGLLEHHVRLILEQWAQERMRTLTH